MATSRFESLWTFMFQNKLKVDGKINNNIICTICKNLLIEPYTSECGCHFCASCIRNYQINGSKVCPGKNSDCSKTLLEIEKNVLTDFTTQFKIAKVIVQCPYDQCHITVEVEKMEEHARVCIMKPANCPYQSIGCEDGGTSCNTVIDHLHADTFVHSQMLVGAFNNLKNDFEIADASKTKELMDFKEEIEKLKSNDLQNQKELSAFKDSLMMKENEIQNLIKEIESLKKPVNFSKKDVDNFKKVMDSNKLEIDGFKKDISKIKIDADNLNQKIKQIECDLQKLSDPDSDKITQIVVELNEMRVEIENIKKTALKMMKKEDFDLQIKKIDKGTTLMKNDTKKCSDDIKKINIRFKEINLKLVQDFVWLIPGFSKQKSQIDSEEFTKFFYKFKLSLLINRDDIKIRLRILKGEFDEMLPWPMKKTFSISVINQENLTVYKTVKFGLATLPGDKNGFNRPTLDEGNLISAMNLLMKDISILPGILHNDSLMVCCSVMTATK